MRLVILESPYLGDTERNIAYARSCLKDCLDRGDSPIASHLLFTQPGVLDDNVVAERALGMEAGLAWYAVAHAAVVYTDFGVSSGMLAGIDRARKHNVPIEFRSLIHVETR